MVGKDLCKLERSPSAKICRRPAPPPLRVRKLLWTFFCTYLERRQSNWQKWRAVEVEGLVAQKFSPSFLLHSTSYEEIEFQIYRSCKLLPRPRPCCSLARWDAWNHRPRRSISTVFTSTTQHVACRIWKKGACLARANSALSVNKTTQKGGERNMDARILCVFFVLLSGAAAQSKSRMNINSVINLSLRDFRELRCSSVRAAIL